MPQPRRTKRCDTCRDRRIRCDEVRPRCGQCIKSRRKCVVPEDTLVFESWTVERNYAAPNTPSRSQSFILYPESSMSSQIASPRNDSNLIAELDDKSLTQLWEKFLQLQLPYTASSIGDCESSIWQSLSQMNTNSRSLRHALGAVASARIGQIERNRTLCEAASHLYGTAVSSLREEICDGTGRTSIDVIATVLTLVAYEFYQDNSSGFGYISHAQGAGRLIQSLGPTHFVSGIPHKLFLNFRDLGIIHAILGRKATFLATTDWSSQPWTMKEKTDFDKLLDIAVLIPGLYEESYLLKSSTDNMPYILRLDLIDRYWKVWDRFLMWYEAYIAAIDSNPAYIIHEWDPLSKGHQSPSTSPGPFSSQLQFRNVETARCLVFYWSFMCCVSSGITWEHRALFGRGTDYKTCPTCASSVQRACMCDYKPPILPLNETEMRPPPGLPIAFATADNIAMSIPYLLQKELKGIGAEICVWPLRVIYEVYRFRNEQQKVQWALEIFKELKYWGISWSASLLEMQFPDYQHQALFGNVVDEHSEASSKSPNVEGESATIELRKFTVV